MTLPFIPLMFLTSFVSLGQAFSFAQYPHLLISSMPPTSLSPTNFRKTLLLLVLKIIHERLSQLNISIVRMFCHVN